MNETVGVVGLGRVGGSVAAAASRAGYRVLGCDVDPDALSALPLATRTASPAELAEHADIVLVAVYDDAQVRAVMRGRDSLLSAQTPPQAVIVLSTVTPETIRWAHTEGSARGVSVLDCGVTGGLRLRECGQIFAMVGGDFAAVAFVRPVLEAFGSPVVHTGQVGTGMYAKLARNMITFGTWCVALEAGQLAVAGGVELERLADICDAADQWADGALGLVRRGIRPGRPLNDRDGQERLRLSGYMHKDLRAAFDAAQALQIELPVTRASSRRSTSCSDSINRTLRGPSIGLVDRRRRRRGRPTAEPGQVNVCAFDSTRSA
jgi:3-hydroxyisobutyrate dehydrogenase-like beta-hydroxyacid dehydrogenase